MAYMRGDPYIWHDGDRLHIWSETGLDDCKEMEGYADNPQAAGVALSSAVLDEYVVMRFAQLLEKGELQRTIDRTLQRSGRNFECSCLHEHHRLLARLKPVSMWKRLLRVLVPNNSLKADGVDGPKH